jgi:hypothetical protein
MQPPSSSQPVATAGVPAFIRLLAWCLFCAAAPVLFLTTGKPKPVVRVPDRPVQEPGDPAPALSMGTEGLDVASAINQLQAEKPDYIAIGNSMVFSRLGMTPEEMNGLTGRKFSFIFRGGSTPAAWYLTLKHVVAASGIHPRLVFFFFRDTELTDQPPAPASNGASHSTGPPKSPAARELQPSPPEQDKFLEGAVDVASRWLSGPKGLYNFSLRRDTTQRRVTNAAMLMGGGTRSETWNRQSLTDRFSLDHLRSDVPSDMAAGDADGDASADTCKPPDGNYASPGESSLLPLLMQVAAEQKFKLLFFRVKRRPLAGSGVAPEPREMRPYQERLRQWIGEHGGLFFDESQDPAIRLEAYNDGDHISEARRDWYRKYFWQRMSSLFP